MADQYFKLHDLVIDRVALDAPIEIEKGALLLDKTTRKVLLLLRLNVLSEDPTKISSVTLNIECYDDAGDFITDINPCNFTFRDIFLLKDKSLGEDTPIILDTRVRRVNVSISRVVYLDSSVWYPPDIKIKPIQQARIDSLNSELLTQFHRDISSFPKKKQENLVFLPQQMVDYWQCACGRPNNNNSTRCRRCGISKEQVFTITNEQNLHKNLEDYREQVRIETERVRLEKEQARLREEELARKKEEERLQLLEKARIRSKRIKTTLWISGALVVSIVLFFSMGLPALKYARAMKFLEDKNYIYAIYMFDSLGDYKNSREMMEEANYQKAVSLLEQEQYDWAIKVFSYNPDYKDSSEMVNESNYQKASSLLPAKRFDDARLIFEGLDDYKDSQQMARESDYQKAIDLFLSGQFNDAYLIFLELNDYKDSKDKAIEANYKKATELLENNQFDEAIEIFTLLKDYQDSSEMISEAKYRKAIAFSDEEKWEESIAIFSEIQEYKDSQAKLMQCQYDLATQFLNSGTNLAIAIELLESLGDYKDSTILHKEALYLYAVHVFNTGQYNKALSYFEKMVDYKDSQIFIKRILLMNKLRSNEWVSDRGIIQVFGKRIVVKVKSWGSFSQSYSANPTSPEFTLNNSSITFKINGTSIAGNYTFNGYTLMNVSTQEIFRRGNPIDVNSLE